MTSHKTVLLALVTAASIILITGCAGSGSGATDQTRPGRVTGGGSADEALDFGENWDEAATKAARDAAEETPSTYWTILLRTYKEFGHEQLADNTARDLSRIDPRLMQARVHTTRSGSMVVFGVYESAADPQAQADLEWIKGLTYANRPVFPLSMLTRINARHARGEFKPNELLAVRQTYPDLDPLYTMQVAVWGDFESGKFSAEEIRRRAERHANELRAQGHEAYFHHDEDQQLSMVTVGLFDRRAFDVESGVYSPAVTTLLRAFPAHLVNGEPLDEAVHPRKPELGMHTQEPRLVLVPKLP